MLLQTVIFIATYVGVALGRFPWLALDRTGIALLGAIAMIEAGTMSFAQAVDAVDLPTILLLYALMVVSAQLKLSGFYTRVAWRISSVLIPA
jgi:Na+/H+ antiporter NhaD/arsenite permease-like protein